MRLYVLPPAFGVPSIEPRCAAAVALLQLFAPRDYEIIPSHEDIDHLPRLVDGTIDLSGFNNISRYIVDRYDSKIARETARSHDETAVTSFIETHAQLLLDISLYVSYENYRTTTRPAFTKILPLHANYIIPPRKRAAARTRTEYLGIASIDIDDVHEDMSNRPSEFANVGKEPQFEAETQKRASLLLPRKDTVRSLLKRPEHAAIFKLHALAEAFFEPLKEMLGSAEYMLQTPQAHAVDCLVYGYLSLMLFPKVPQDWLAATMKRKYPSLVAYTERIHRTLALQIDAQAVMALAACHGLDEVGAQRQSLRLVLPWTTPASSKPLDTIMSIVRGISDQFPLLGTSSMLNLKYAPKRSSLERHLPLYILSMSGSCAAVVYLAVRLGWVLWPSGQEVHIFGKKRISDYGNLGAALMGIGSFGAGT